MGPAMWSLPALGIAAEAKEMLTWGTAAWATGSILWGWARATSSGLGWETLQGLGSALWGLGKARACRHGDISARLLLEWQGGGICQNIDENI